MGFEENWGCQTALKGSWEFLTRAKIPDVPLDGEWDWFSGYPGIAVATDGRLALFDGSQVLVFPAPAAEIYTNIKARRASKPSS